MAFKSPCTPNCEGRSGICHTVCEAWKKYEAERNRLYAERTQRKQAEQDSYRLNPYYKGKSKK